MVKRITKAKKMPYEAVAFSFQGGGALGAYQAGVAIALQEGGYQPDWIIGASIGAINAAIVVGNKPEDRTDKLYAFWNYIATPLIEVYPYSGGVLANFFQNYLSALYTLTTGQPGFFQVRYPNPLLGMENSAEKISFYDSSELRSTLERFIDFDRINQSKKIRLSIGTVKVRTGEMVYFDNNKCQICPEHIMASCALPPGFSAVNIDNDLYWDGGISNNTPISHFIYDERYHSALCFMVDLFDSNGSLPRTLDEILKRKKDIQFSSQFTNAVKLCKDMHCFKHTINELAKLVPKKQKKNPKVRAMIERGCNRSISLVRFFYKSSLTDLSSKDYEFSEASTKQHLEAGYSDAKQGMKYSPWLAPIDDNTGIKVHNMAQLLVG